MSLCSAPRKLAGLRAVVMTLLAVLQVMLVLPREGLALRVAFSKEARYVRAFVERVYAPLSMELDYLVSESSDEIPEAEISFISVLDGGSCVDVLSGDCLGTVLSLVSKASKIGSRVVLWSGEPMDLSVLLSKIPPGSLHAVMHTWVPSEQEKEAAGQVPFLYAPVLTTSFGERRSDTALSL